MRFDQLEWYRSQYDHDPAEIARPELSDGGWLRIEKTGDGTYRVARIYALNEHGTNIKIEPIAESLGPIEVQCLLIHYLGG